MGDDGRCGTAQSYDVRVSDQPINDANFASASPVAVGAPKPAGSTDLFGVPLPDSAAYVAVRGYDPYPT